MNIFTLHPKYAFLFKNHPKYQIIYEFSTPAEYDHHKRNGCIDDNTSYYIGYPGSITEYLKTLMYIAGSKIPVITVSPSKNDKDMQYIFETRTHSLEVIEHVHVSPLSNAVICTQMWNYMQEHNRNIHAVAAVEYEHFYIGTGIDQYFYIKEDLQHFKKLTKDSWCICGLNTWKALPNRKLTGKTLLVVTSNHKELNKQYASSDCMFVSSINDGIIKWLTTCDSSPNLYSIGGERLWEELDALTKFYHITEIRYSGKNVPWKEGDRKFDFKYDPNCAHENEQLTEITTSEPVKIHEYLKTNREIGKVGKICNDPMEIVFHTYEWLPLSQCKTQI